MHRVRLKLAKIDKTRFLSHLELMRTFERALRRTSFPYVITQGYSPRPKFSWGPPLMIGASSVSEYVDLFTKGKIGVQDLVSQFNLNLPEGLKVIEANYIDFSLPSLMSLAAVALYEIGVEVDKDINEEIIKDYLDSFLSLKKVKTVKKGKERVVDLKDKILSLNLSKVDKRKILFRAMLSLISETISPFQLVELILAEKGLNLVQIDVSRVELYGWKDKSLTSLMNL